MKKLVFIFLLLLSSSAFSDSKILTLKYDQELIKNGFTSPLVDIEINGLKGTFLIDSGASINILARWFSDKIKIETNGTVSTGDSSGSNGNISFSLLDFQIKTSNNEAFYFRKQVVGIVNLPEVFSQNNIAGIISPQQLLSEQETLSLNLTLPSITISRKSLSNLTNKNMSPLNVTIQDGPYKIKTSLYSIVGALDNTPATLIIDTGASDIGVGVDTIAGKALWHKAIESSEQIGGIHGTPQKTYSVPKVELKIFNKILTTKVRLQPIAKEMPADGMIGMDFLRNCSLILTKKMGWIDCP